MGFLHSILAANPPTSLSRHDLRRYRCSMLSPHFRRFGSPSVVLRRCICLLFLSTIVTNGGQTVHGHRTDVQSWVLK
jgi:hypothetical protein